jgi:hypothetical protein
MTSSFGRKLYCVTRSPVAVQKFEKLKQSTLLTVNGTMLAK